MACKSSNTIFFVTFYSKVFWLHVVTTSALQWSDNEHDDVSTASRLFTQAFIQAQINKNTKAPRHWHLWGEFTGDREFPAQRANNAEMFANDDVIMRQTEQSTQIANDETSKGF